MPPIGRSGFEEAPLPVHAPSVTERAPSGEGVYRLRLRMHASEALRRTPLHDRHLAAGARMVPFAGWEMPVQYEGVIPEHRAVREHAGVFDVSHMGQLEVRGPAALEFLQTMLSNDLSRIGMGQAQYTLLLDENGCPIDDLIAYRLDDDHLLLVVNAARVDDDRDWLVGRAARRARFSTTARPTWRCSRSRARRRSTWWSCRSSRRSSSPAPRCAASSASSPAPATPASRASRSWWRPTRPERSGTSSLAAGATPAGLGARDTLRLEVCYPLYGNDLSQSRTALEAGLGWVCALDRKEFVGAPALRSPARAGRPRPAGRVPDVRARDPAPGDGHPARRRGDERDDVADARGRDRDGIRPRRPRRRGHRDRDRRARAAGCRARCAPSPCT